MTPLTTPEAAALMKIGRGRMRGLIKNKEIKTFSYSTGNRNHLLIDGDELLKFVIRKKLPSAIVKAVKARARE